MTYFQVIGGQTITADHMNAAINQGVIPFPNAAARAAAIPAPGKGMHTWLDDPGVEEVWNGTGWKKAGPLPEMAGGTAAAAIDASSQVTIPFGRTFSSAPVVVASIGDNAPTTVGMVVVLASTVTATQFKALVLTRTGGTYTSSTARINWLAFVASTFAHLLPAPEPDPPAEPKDDDDAAS